MSQEVYDFIISQRAIRSYRDEPLFDAHLDAILEAARWTGSSKNHQAWSFIIVTDPERLQRLADCGDFTDPVRNSAATIVIVQEPDGYEFDSGRAAQNIMLAARTQDVASCPVTFHRDRDAAALLGVPDDRRTRYGVALGYPSESAGPADFGGRKPADQIIHWERYR